MGTRGAIGFRFEGTDKLTYCHSDSYPTYLGKEVIQNIQKMDVSSAKSIFKKIKMVE